MRRASGWAAALGLGLALVALPARAQLGAVAAAGIGSGVAANVASDQPPAARLPGREPPDWLEPRTGTTTVLGRGCGAVTQVTLTATPSAAFLNVLVLNEAREHVAFDPGATMVDFGGRVRRRVTSPLDGHLDIEPGWQRWLSLPLPSKADLEDSPFLEVELSLISPSFGACHVTSRIVRPAGPRRAETYTPYTVGEFSFAGGVRMLTTGNLHELAPKPGVSVGFDFTVFFSLHHGATLDLALETPGRTKAAEVLPDRSFDSPPTIEAAGFFLGYVARLPVAPWLSLSYSPQVGVVPFQLVDGKRGAQETSAVFCPRQRLRAVLPFARLLDGNVYTGLTFAHTYVPYGELGAVDLSGNLLSGVVVLGIGG